ncbi:RNA polymerase sigma factor [Xanthovirga aplysinae]|uniref:RNA polymerase sigma factor n=1 Tax=Xanthovirga aplysinae TaxID=2529853 RepID=UPI0012BB6825|nr:sigma-70 family RNA polymerase sigma factor [Xanthovirga aplysinae]MTI33648.1 sigma-70 family RNA polymerase sigma factor [Xanthovirga aplysinae]
MKDSEKQFKSLLEQNQGLLIKICNTYTEDEEDRKDLYQEIAIQIWKSMQSYRGDSAISTWMYRVALNTALTHFKKSTRKGKTMEAAKELAYLEDRHCTSESTMPDQYTMLMQAIKKLKKIERAIAVMYLEGKDFKEISEILGISAVNARVKMSRVKDKLRKIIKDYDHAG